MPIVAYGYGLDTSLGGGVVPTEEIVVALNAEPDITLEPEVVVTVEPDPIDIELEPDIEVEVET